MININNLLTKWNNSQSIIGLNHYRHADRNHVDVDLLVTQDVHIQVVVVLGLTVLGLVYLVQLLQENNLQLLDLLVYLVHETVTLLHLLKLLQTQNGLLEVRQQIGMSVLRGPLLNVLDELLDRIYAVLLLVGQLGRHLILDHHQLLPIL
jgi:hypothetical protein